MLASDKHADLRVAVAGAAAEEQERACRQTAVDGPMRLRELLDARGVDVEARDLLYLLAPRLDIDARYRDMLLREENASFNRVSTRHRVFWRVRRAVCRGSRGSHRA